MLGRMALLAATNSGIPWTPAQISTALWLDASDNSTIFSDNGITQATNGNGIYLWKDKSGNARNVSQPTSAKRPTFATGALNGKSAIVFSDNTRWLLGAAAQESAFDFTNTFYVFVVAVANTSVDSSNVLVNKGSQTYTSTGWYFELQGTTSYSLIGITAPSTPNVIGATGLASAVNIVSFEANTSGTRVRANGSTQSTSNTPFSAGLNNNPMLIGAYETVNASSANFMGTAHQIIIASSPPTLSVIQQLEGWAASLYGLTANLPSDHPYKNTPPYI
jgi:hypothetical protein